MRREIRPEAFLARLPLFEGLGPQGLARLASATTRRELKRGEILFREGEPSSGLYALVYGSIQLATREGRVIDIVLPGRSFGEPVMFMEKPWIVTASALADSLVLHVSRQAIFDELERSPPFARRAIGALSERAEGLVRQLEARAAGPAAHRLVAWLLRQPAARVDGEATITLPGAKRALASQLDLSAEHLSRVLRELADRGLIEVQGRRVRVPDLERLRQSATAARRPSGAG
ncbi:MAG TPA: Crp/Fnr family transcriptional regulator [Burkholderiales bacterium]|nr:Crp/Fnr family transcriptional regulator [Burkholderiales bacterium]